VNKGELSMALFTGVAGEVYPRVRGNCPDIIRQLKSRRMRWAGYTALMGEGRNVCRVLVGKPERKRPLERPRRRCEDGINMDLREIKWGGAWSGFTWHRIRIAGGLL
jgi:hypothetical protein